MSDPRQITNCRIMLSTGEITQVYGGYHAADIKQMARESMGWELLRIGEPDNQVWINVAHIVVVLP